MIDETTKKAYVDIKGIAKYLGYDAHNGEYKVYSEDTNKCWVESKEETASFFLNSNKISKIPPDQSLDYEDYTIPDPVVNRNGKLYCSSDGIKVGFNVTFNYVEAENKVEIYTLPTLVKQYSTIFKNYGYTDGVSTNFNNQKAILYNMFVVKKDNNLYGVVNSNNEEIISSKYKSMEFNESAKEFYVTNNSNKVGIVTQSGVTKINLLYDEINMIDKQSGLYVVKSGTKYGVLGSSGNIIIHLEYEKIGIDATQFPSNNISNKYLLYETVIPVYQNKKWGLFNTAGDLIVPVEFDKIGCTEGASSTSNVNNLLLVPNYKAIILGKTFEEQEEKRTYNQYGVYNNKGEQLIPCRLDRAYSVTNAGVDTFYMEYQGKTMDIEKYIVKFLKLDSEM